MFRRYKCILLSTCALLLVLLVLMQYRGNNFTVIQEIQGNGSRIPVAVTTSTLNFIARPSSFNPVPSDDVLQKMSHVDLQSFYHSYINSPQITCSRVERMGKLTDGGWEICDDPLYRPLKGDCLVYSFGISFDYSYDDDMATYGCDVHAFDPSMNIAAHLRGERVFFHPYGIGAKDGYIISPPKNEKWGLLTLDSHRKVLQHEPNQRRLDIVKMDVEGHEIDSLSVALDEGLSDVRQLSFETHVAWGNFDPTKEQYIQFLGLLRKVYEKGFRIYITHRNYVYSAFDSKLVMGKKRAYCHEVHTININYKNIINADGSVVGDNAISSDVKSQRHDKQKQLMSQDQAIYKKKLEPNAQPAAAQNQAQPPQNQPQPPQNQPQPPQNQPQPPQNQPQPDQNQAQPPQNQQPPLPKV